MLRFRYPNLTVIIALLGNTALKCISVWERRWTNISSYNRTAYFYIESKDFCFQHQNHWYGSSEARWHDFCAQLHAICRTLLACSPPGLGSKLWDGKDCKHKVLFKIQTSSKKPHVLTTRKISFKIFRQNCSRELQEETITEQRTAQRKLTASILSQHTKAKHLTLLRKLPAQKRPGGTAQSFPPSLNFHLLRGCFTTGIFKVKYFDI